jgi:bacteriocin biosynthesis cyclodehydratase domain-containing protein
MSTEPNRRLPLEGVTVAVVGAGRIGSELIRNLDQMGIGRIEVFERDPRIAAPLRSRYTVYDGDFWDTLTLARLQTFDFAVCTLGDRSSRQRMNQKCLVANVNLMEACTEGSLAIVGAYPFAALPDAACAECEAARSAIPLPIASLKLAVEEIPAAAVPAARIAGASVAGALAAALIARITAGSHGSAARRATLDATLGQGSSLEVRRDPHCPRCGMLQRPVPIVQTRNRWGVSASVAEACPDMLNQRLQLSDEIEGLPLESCCVRELAARFHGGPIPAKFALTEVGGRVVCLDFEEAEPGPAHAVSRAAAGHHPSN